MARTLMLVAAMLAGAALVTGARGQEPQPGFLGRPLAEARESGFFVWFHLTETASAVDAKGGRLVSYKPSGPRFHDLTTLQVAVDGRDNVQRMDLWLLRAFIESGGNAPFARDIAKSFLAAAPPADDASALASLAAEIEHRLGPSERVIVGPGYVKPELPPEPSQGYACYAGTREAYRQDLAHSRLEMRNEAGPDGLGLRLSLIATQ